MSLLSTIKELRLNPEFDFEEDQIEIVSDERFRLSLEIAMHLRSLGLNISSLSLMRKEDLELCNELVRKQADELFEIKYGMIEAPISRELMEHSSSVENKTLINKLKVGMDTKDIIYSEFERIIFDPNNTSLYALDHYLKHVCGDKGHVLAITQNTNMVAPLVVSKIDDQISLAYHPLGRNGKIYGAFGHLDDKKDMSQILINTTPFQDTDYSFSNYCIEILNHEIVGHGFMNLEDHNGVDPKSCLMATKKSDAEYLEATKEPKGIYLCDSCKSALTTTK